MKILIIQSMGYTLVKELITKSIHSVDIDYTDSFDHAVELAGQNKYELVIASHMFHDKFSKHRPLKAGSIEDNAKNGNLLAQMLKNINPKTKVYIFSEYTPNNEFVDGYIFKTGDRRVSLNKVVSFVKQFLHSS